MIKPAFGLFVKSRSWKGKPTCSANRLINIRTCGLARGRVLDNHMFAEYQPISLYSYICIHTCVCV